IVGTDNTGLLHIRIFDALGRLVTDTDETKLPPTQANAIATLKQQLPGLLPPHVLTAAEKAQVIAEVTSIAGQTLDHQMQSVTYVYDKNNNMTSATEVKTVGGQAVTEAYTYVYDALDRLTSSTNYDNKTIGYAYDRQGNSLTITDPDNI